LLDLAFGKCGLVFNAITGCDDPDILRKQLIPFEFKQCYELFRMVETRPYTWISFGDRAGSLSDIYHIAHNLDLQLCSSIVISPRHAFSKEIEKILQNFQTKFDKSAFLEQADLKHQGSGAPCPVYKASLRLMFDRRSIPEFGKRGLLTALSG